MKYKLRLSEKVYDPKKKGYREKYFLTRALDSQQAQAILKLLEVGKVAGEDHGARGEKLPLLQGTPEGEG